MTQARQERKENQTTQRQVECVVCGTNVDKDQALTVTYQDRTLYACGSNCQNQFQADPVRFMNKGIPTANPNR